MKTFKKAIVVVMLALSALPAFAQDIPTDPDGDGIPTGRDLCPLAYGSGSDGCPSGNYASRPQPGVLDNAAGGGVIVLMGDGSVKFLKDSVSLAVNGVASADQNASSHHASGGVNALMADGSVR
jgi:prepilin-type processing-associated H-X9-DG protein